MNIKELERKLNLRGFSLKNINLMNEDEVTALMSFAGSKSNKIEEVKLLLENGADPDIQDDMGDTALTWAAVNGNIEIAELLLKYGADVNKGLKAAVSNLQKEMIIFLLENGANESLLSESTCKFMKSILDEEFQKELDKPNWLYFV